MTNLERDSMLFDKLKEVFQAIFPISLIVLILHLFFVPLSGLQLGLFIIGALFALIGLTIFLLGVEVSVSQMGQILGQGITRKENLLWLALGGLIIGFIVSIAEPSLIILGSQVNQMSQGAIGQNSLVIIVSIGVAIFMTIGLFRIVFQWNISIIMGLFYLMILGLSIVSEESYLAFSFDSSGATTGALTVPFMLSMSVGVASLSSSLEQSEEFNFGLVGITSIGPIISVLILGLFAPTHLASNMEVEEASAQSIGHIVGVNLYDSFLQVIVGVIPLVLIFGVYHLFIEKQKPLIFKEVMMGLGYLMLGLTLFLTGVASGFMPISRFLGGAIYTQHDSYWLIIIGFTLGVVAILAEPAIYVLVEQIEEVSGGAISRKLVLYTIAIGVGLAIALTILRILIPDFKLWHILAVGYVLIIILSWIIPKLFVGIAFDSGGTASGPMTGTFIFAFIQGIAINHPTADAILDGFGMIATVAMTPILFIELLGLVVYLMEQHETD